jgi:translation initiation factor 1
LASPFATLAKLRSQLPAADSKPALAASSERAEAPPTRALVRLERKGRGGKEVTVIEGLALGSGELEAWLSSLKDALGCGGSLEEQALVLQGDQRARVPDLLLALGVRKVIRG